MIDKDFLGILTIVTVCIIVSHAIAPKLENHRNERLELMRKYPECAEAAYPIKCVRYKRMLER